MSAAIVLFARAPSAPGKTRLTDGLPPAAAQALREALLLDTFDAVRSAATWVIVSFTPAAARSEMEALFGAGVARLVGQRGDDLGSRMQAAMVDAFDQGAAHVVLVGADVPTLPSSYVAEAFALLEQGHDLVLGPAEDGGYYLIGLRSGEHAEQLFAGIGWGTARVLVETLAAAQEAGLSTALLKPWYDVDHPEDLARVTSARTGEGRRIREWRTAFGL